MFCSLANGNLLTKSTAKSACLRSAIVGHRPPIPVGLTTPVSKVERSLVILHVNKYVTAWLRVSSAV